MPTPTTPRQTTEKSTREPPQESPHKSLSESTDTLKQAWIGVIDLGSSAIKCMAATVRSPQTLKLVAQLPVPLQEAQDDALQSEFEPAELNHVIQQALDALATFTVDTHCLMVAIALTGQVGGALLLDQQGKLQRPCLTWADRRAAAEAQTFADTFGQEFQTLLGHPLPAQTCWSAPKFHRLAHQKPDTLASTSTVMQLPDYAFYQYTSRRLTTPTLAITLAHQRQQQYAGAICQWAGLREDQLPKLPPVGSLVASGRLSGPLAARWRLIQPDAAEGPRIVLAGADMYCGLHGVMANLTQRIIQAGTTEIAGVIVTPEHQPAQPHTLLRLAMPGNHVNENTSHITPDPRDVISRDVIYGSTSNGGMSLTWLAQKHNLNLTDESLWSQTQTLAQSHPPDAQSLIFIPHIHGARAPLWRDDATGGFVTADNALPVSLNDFSPQQKLLAVLQGCAMNKRTVLEAAGRTPSHASDLPILVAGGGGRRDLPNQIRANVMNQTICVRNVSDVTAAGAIAITLDHLFLTQPNSGHSWLSQLHNAAGSRTYQPTRAHAAEYDTLYKRYLKAEAAMLPATKHQPSTH